MTSEPVSRHRGRLNEGPVPRDTVAPRGGNRRLTDANQLGAVTAVQARGSMGQAVRAVEGTLLAWRLLGSRGRAADLMQRFEDGLLPAEFRGDRFVHRSAAMARRHLEQSI
jgi:hypothetical protein